MRRVLFSGHVNAYGGPAEVNRSYLIEGQGWIDAPQGAPGFAQVVHLIRNRREYRAVLASNLSGFHVLLIVVARALGIRTWYLAHGIARDEMRYNSRFNWRSYCVETLTIAVADHVIAVSSVLRDQMISRFKGDPSRFHVVLNGGELQDPEGRERAEGSSSPPDLSVVRIVTIGAYPVKNVYTLCRAVAQLPSAHLTILGPTLDGSNPFAGLPRVTYVGRVDPSEVPRYLAAAQIYAQISVRESFGLAICQAALMGCELLVASSAGCLPVLTDMRFGNTVDDVTDVAAVTQSLSLLMERVRAGHGVMHRCERSWADAASELRDLVCT